MQPEQGQENIQPLVPGEGPRKEASDAMFAVVKATGAHNFFPALSHPVMRCQSRGGELFVISFTPGIFDALLMRTHLRSRYPA